MDVDRLSPLSHPDASQPTTDADADARRSLNTTPTSTSAPAQLSALRSLRRSASDSALPRDSVGIAARFRSSPASPRPTASSAPRTLTNRTNDAQFFPLVNEIRNHDEHYVYVTHGTLLDNVPGITQHGLDPAQGGGKNGAASYESVSSSDARGNLKYAHDPNISLKYSNEPANHRKVGVQLEARVKRDQIQSRFTTGRAGSGREPTFWRPESGGENAPATLNDERYRQSMASSMPTDEQGSHIWSSESNQPIPPEDVRVIGVSVPPGQSVDVSKLKTRYGKDRDGD